MLSIRRDIRNTRIAFAITSFVVALAILWLIYVRIQGDALAFNASSCYLSEHYHLYCPSCGGTRALKLFVQGHFIKSLLSNPIPVYTAVLVIRIWTALLINGFTNKGKEKPVKVMYQWEMWGILVVIAGFFILRNVLLVVFGVDYLGDLASYWQ